MSWWSGKEIIIVAVVVIGLLVANNYLHWFNLNNPTISGIGADAQNWLMIILVLGLVAVYLYRNQVDVRATMGKGEALIALRNSPDDVDKWLYSLLAQNYELDLMGGGIQPTEDTTDSGTYFYNFVRKNQNLKLPLQLMVGIDTKRFPNPPSSSRLKFFSEKRIAFALQDAMSLRELNFGLQGMPSQDLRKLAAEMIRKGELDADTVFSITAGSGLHSTGVNPVKGV